MIKRLMLGAASIATALVIAGGLAAAGFGTARPAEAVSAVPAAETAPQPDPQVQVETIYLTPEATPQEITVTEVRERPRGDDEDGEHEGREGNEGGEHRGGEDD